MTNVHVLRLGHRPTRDKRVSTHVALVARALGAESVYYTGEKDKSMEENIKKVVSEWGGSFTVKYLKDWRKMLKEWEGEKVHLTMYGLPFQDNLKKINCNKDILVIVGGSKVPPDVYESANHNLAVTNQPHSEIAALAVFLDHLFGHSILNKEFENAKLKIVPQEKGKKVLGNESNC